MTSRETERRRAEALASLARARMTLNLAWTSPDTDDDFLIGLRGAVTEELGRVQSDVPLATKDEDFCSLDDRIQLCTAKRSYWLVTAQVQTEADSCFREMRTWGVPQAYLDEHLRPLRDGIRTALAEAAGSDSRGTRESLRRAQASLEAVFLEYTYWDWYTRRYVKTVVTTRTAVLGIAGVVALVLAVLLAFCFDSRISSVVLAGLTGICASILLKQEPMAVYGEMIKWWIWATGRVITGLVATVIGMGLLASGFISIGFSQDTNGDPKGLVPLHAIIGVCLDFQDKTSEGAPARRSDAGVADALPAGGESSVDASEKPKAAAEPTVPPAPCRKRTPCGNGAMLLVLGLAMLFGFSERAFVKLLGQFEDRLGSTNDHGPTPPPVATAPTGTGSALKDGESAARSKPSPAAPVQAPQAAVALPAQVPTAPDAVQPADSSTPAQPRQRTPTSPGLPTPSAGPPAAKPLKPSGT